MRPRSEQEQLAPNPAGSAASTPPTATPRRFVRSNATNWGEEPMADKKPMSSDDAVPQADKQASTETAQRVGKEG